MTDNFTVKDSGARSVFSTGMVRDTEEGKVDFTTVFNGPMFRRWAVHLTRGAVKYPDVKPGSPNWMLAETLEEYHRARRSTTRHFVQAMNGERDEDHHAAIFFGFNLMEYIRDRLIEKGEWKGEDF